MLRTLRLFFASIIETVRLRHARGPARPSWSVAFECVVRYLRRDWDETSEWPHERVRQAVERRPYPSGVVRKVRCRDEVLGGVAVRWFVPPNADERRRVLFFHGGSFIYGSSRTTHADVIARLALASNVTVVSVEYRFAPEHPYPAQLADALAAFDGLVASGTAEGAIVVAGDSAGGNLALALQMALRDRGTSQARSLLLVSPWTDLTMPGRSFVDNDRWDFGTRAVLERQARAFAGNLPLADPRISPIHGRLTGLAPVFVIAGEAEILRDDIVALVDRLGAANVPVELHVAKDMPHNPPIFAAFHPSASRALDEAASFVTR
jgi:acetyl esterase/lipase